jgi:glycosyltransferase involved in cell wall biosynthesis
MAMGKPIVSTTLGVEGLPVRDGEHLVVADRPRAFADAMLTLFDEASRRDALGSSARALVVERFSAETVARQFEACCLEAVARAGRARPR